MSLHLIHSILIRFVCFLSIVIRTHQTWKGEAAESQQARGEVEHNRKRSE